MAPKPKAERLHKATYATDKRKGGYLVRVEGPSAAQFAGREVPVTQKGGDEHMEMLAKLIWSGADKESGKPCALYSFEPRPRETQEIEF